MPGNSPTIMVVTGETSGDQRAAEVVLELRAIHPGLQVFGMGGTALRKAGAEIIADISETAVFGITEIIPTLAKLKRFRDTLLAQWRSRGADAALLVDFGGFNLRLARKLKRIGGRVVYYISPQVWASRPGRIKWVRRYVDLMLVLFSFERELYSKHGVNASHVGHPLLDMVVAPTPRDRLLASRGLDPSQKVIGLMPGSRRTELRRLLPPILAASDNLRQRGFGQQIVIAAPGREEQIARSLAGRPIRLIGEDHYSAMAASDLLIMASGTAALEAAILGVPAVVVYRASPVTAFLARLLMKVKHVSLPNIILGEEVYPELLQGRCRPDRIAAEAARILENTERYDRIQRRLTEITRSLGEPGAAARAAGTIADFLERG